MPEKLSNEQRHERFWCGFTHIRVAWFFVAFCALMVFSSWRALDKPISRPSITELPFYILMVAFYAPVFLMVFRCFSERFVVGIAAVHTAMAVVSWFVPTLFNSVTHLVGRVFFALWALAFLMTLNMPVQSIRNPYVQPEKGDTGMKKRNVLILFSIIVASLLLGALMYFIPSR